MVNLEEMARSHSSLSRRKVWRKCMDSRLGPHHRANVTVSLGVQKTRLPRDTHRIAKSLFIFGAYLDPNRIIYGTGSREAQSRYTRWKSSKQNSSPHRQHAANIQAHSHKSENPTNHTQAQRKAHALAQTLQ
jgi:hypothetical protein